jgi:hypothetical protein
VALVLPDLSRIESVSYRLRLLRRDSSGPRVYNEVRITSTLPGGAAAAVLPCMSGPDGLNELQVEALVSEGGAVPLLASASRLFWCHEGSDVPVEVVVPVARSLDAGFADVAIVAERCPSGGEPASIDYTLRFTWNDPSPPLLLLETRFTATRSGESFAGILPCRTTSAGEGEITLEVEGVAHIPGQSPQELRASTTFRCLRGQDSRVSVSLELPCPPIQPGDFCTFTQGGWGSKASGSNPGTIRDANFFRIATESLPASCGTVGVVIGAVFPRQIGFTTSSAIQAFLPQGGTPAALKTDKFLCNPTRTNAGVFAGQILAASLNVGFSDLGVLPQASPTPLGDLVYVSGPCAGWTVREVLARAEIALSGGTPPGSTCRSIQELNAALDGLNNNFDDCVENGGLLRLP